MRHRSTALACALTAALGLLALPASGARADSSVPLTQLTGFHQIVVDSAAGYLFLSEGVDSASLVTGGANAAAGSAIVVTDLSGNYVTTLDTGKGVEGLALSSDGGTLYAALAEDDAVGVIDTATLTQTAEYSLGTAVATPYSLAIQSGKLWVSYNGTPAGSAGEGAIGDLDLSAASPALETQAATSGWYSAPDLAADPSGTGVLAAAQPGETPLTAATYNVSADPATQTINAPSLADCDEYGAAVFPGGTRFMVCGSTYSTATMSSQAGGSLASALANAISPDGSLEALGSAAAAYVYQAGGSVPVNRFGFASPESLAPAGLAFSADDTKLYAVLHNTGGTPYSLQVFDNPAATRTTLTLSGTGEVHLGTPVTLNGSFQLSTGSAPAGAQISITRTEADAAGSVDLTAVTASGGSFTLTDTPAATGTYTYTASYPGSAGTAPATATFTATVTLVGSFLTLTTPPRVLPGTAYTVTGSLGLDTGNPPAGTTVTITRTVAGSAAATDLSATTAANGSFTLAQRLTTPGTYTYKASYAGNGVTAPATATATVTVKLTQTILGVTVSASGIGYGGTVKVTAHLGTTYTNRTLSLYAQTVGARTRKLLERGRVDTRGNLTVSYTAAHSTLFTASFAGDAHYAAAAASRTVGVGVKVAMTNSGYFSTKNIAGVTYRVYHHTGDLGANVTVTPDKSGQCVNLEVQQWDPKGKVWFANATVGCFALSKSSEVSTYLTLLQAGGARYRVRADYARSGSDPSNISTDGSWFYFEVVK